MFTFLLVAEGLFTKCFVVYDTRTIKSIVVHRHCFSDVQ